jgi:hypothetical protein
MTVTSISKLYVNIKDKAIPAQAWTGHDVSRRLMLPHFMTVGP